MQLIEQLSKEMRTISHLLHPPLLDEIGLLPAIKMFAEGFAERSNVKSPWNFRLISADSHPIGNFDFPHRAGVLDQRISPFRK